MSESCPFRIVDSASCIVRSSDGDHLHADDVLVARFDLPHDILSRFSIEVDAGDRGMGALEDDVLGLLHVDLR